MNELIEALREGLDNTGELAEVALNAFSLVFIVLGVVLSLSQSLQQRRRLPGIHPLHTFFRTALGGWLVVALEFQLAADIVGSIVSPSTHHLIELAAIAVIRTFLNYFLNKELLEQRELSRADSTKAKAI